MSFFDIAVTLLVTAESEAEARTKAEAAIMESDDVEFTGFASDDEDAA